MSQGKPGVRTLVALCAATLAGAGCSGKSSHLVAPDLSPAVTLSVTRLHTASADSAAFELKWSGTAGLGSVDHYLIAIDPHTLAPNDPAWQVTRQTHRVYGFSGDHAGAVPVQHVVALRAVDARGVESSPVQRTLALTNIPPTVQILRPVPLGVGIPLPARVQPTVNFSWTGNDPDGVITQHPVKYKFRLFKDGDPIFNWTSPPNPIDPEHPPPPNRTAEFDFALAHPDSLRNYCAPAFAGFDSVGGDTTSVQRTNLVPGSLYLFVLVGFDEAGDYNPVWSPSTNMLLMLVAAAGTDGPLLSVYNEYFNHAISSGDFYNDPAHAAHVQVPGGIPLTFHWSALVLGGTPIDWYRWALDLADLSDETPRSNEQTDWYHWSMKSSQTTSATIGPFNPPAGGREFHTLYIEAQDLNGNYSLGVLRFLVTPRVFPDENSLLIVNDTRLIPDQLVDPPDPMHPDSVGPPLGMWPTAAELDTFLLAHGSVRHRMTPDGTLSQPGIFAGYHFDTVSTRFMPGDVMPLTLLERYRHVIWFVDVNSATGINSSLGAGLLARMSQPGHENTLAAYIKQGGQVWLAGGQACSATMLPWNNRVNDNDPPAGVPKFSSDSLSGRAPELGPGRFMFDIAHWRSEIYVYYSVLPVLRSPSAGGWPGAPNYALLPAQLGNKTAANDPVPPFRRLTSFLTDARFHNLEYLSAPNSILDGTGASILDTLFIAQGVPPPPSPPAPYLPACMTYYHGPDSGGLLFSGFDLWTYTRPDLITLADFVLQQVWKLPRDPIPRPATYPPVAGRPRGL